jgi:chromosome segregation protein
MAGKASAGRHASVANIQIENGWEDALEAVLRERLNAAQLEQWNQPPLGLTILLLEVGAIRAEPTAPRQPGRRISLAPRMEDAAILSDVRYRK